ncbi:Phage head-tail joining protein [compost metagenome]
MLAREYNRRIEILEYISSPDGYGGNIVSSISLGNTWSKLVNSSSSVAQRLTSLGISDLYEPLIFKIRFRNDLNYNGRNLSLTYNNQEYVIKSITDIDMFHRELEIVCTKANPVDIPLIPATT